MKRPSLPQLTALLFFGWCVVLGIGSCITWFIEERVHRNSFDHIKERSEAETKRENSVRESRMERAERQSKIDECKHDFQRGSSGILFGDPARCRKCGVAAGSL